MDLKEKKWWPYVEKGIKSLFVEAFTLMEFAKESDQKFGDYAFVVFPAAKGYEGLLKKVFLDLGFITKEDFFGKRFRIGKALNPSLEKAFRHESVYDQLVDHCNGKEIADKLWQTWRLCRNLVFHWFPNEKNSLDLDEAKDRLEMILSAIDSLFAECKIN
ncbi:hypothetical protein KJ570_01240 [Patescibacteria group bacterium]|nr:hypothetical protein [Patescibacteria group bacterium]MBU2035968.1 hypothetical protein [Patescibacteria group bacterium]